MNFCTHIQKSAIHVMHLILKEESVVKISSSPSQFLKVFPLVASYLVLNLGSPIFAKKMKFILRYT